jgi:hypothetical protein
MAQQLNMLTSNNAQKFEMPESSEVSHDMCVDAGFPELVSFIRNCADANDVVELYTGLCGRSYLDVLLCHMPLCSYYTVTNIVLSKAVDLLYGASGEAMVFDRFHCREQRAIRTFVRAALEFSRTGRSRLLSHTSPLSSSGNRVSLAVRKLVLEVVNIVDSIPDCACPDCRPPLQKGTNTPLRRSMRIRNARL